MHCTRTPNSVNSRASTHNKFQALFRFVFFSSFFESSKWLTVAFLRSLDVMPTTRTTIEVFTRWSFSCAACGQVVKGKNNWSLPSCRATNARCRWVWLHAWRSSNRQLHLVLPRVQSMLEVKAISHSDQFELNTVTSSGEFDWKMSARLTAWPYNGRCKIKLDCFIGCLAYR